MVDVPSGLRERKKAATRTRLVEVARALFQTRGFERTTIEEICDQAQVSQGTFFNYFTSKYGVLGEIARRAMAEILEHMKDAGAAHSSTEARLRDFYDRMFRWLDEDQQLALVVLELGSLRTSEIEDLRELDSQRRSLIELTMRQGQTAGEIRDDFTAQELAVILNSLGAVAVTEWLRRKESVEVGIARAERMVDFFMEAVSAESPGRKRR
jgi:AcrR family transcriptional regulator